ncbi:hypothetical protein NDU88_007144 [Pleurodeles waltl]|uniref:Uncharacterized protein n=1 Tax=Pleurodeles waltl TaxID=8319 RepID=A0AAV7VSY9_PLEWA|nr:hypothetical protein NDU88_007144 [Pleurodeles waltl]
MTRADRLDADDASKLLGLEPLPGGLGSWTIPRSCGPRREAELRGEKRERREAAGAAGAARRDRTTAGPPTGDALNNRKSERHARTPERVGGDQEIASLNTAEGVRKKGVTPSW